MNLVDDRHGFKMDLIEDYHVCMCIFELCSYILK